MKRAALCVVAASLIVTAGCAGLSTVNYSRCDRGRKISRIAVIAYNQTTADRHKMWAWAKRGPNATPVDTFDEQVVASLAAKTDYRIIPPATVREALKKLNIQNKPILSLNEIRNFRRLTGADAVLFADISFYLQNYLFYKTFGLIEITMRLKGTLDNRLLWEAKGRNFALFISTDSALKKTRDKMLVQLARKLASDKPMAM
ncbi:MAG: hypothetical protein P8123_06625 [bacterium]|jgi:hypothetical protein